MTETHKPKVSKKKLISPIWILPITAFLLGAWLLASYIQERGTVIEIHFPTANGIEANKTLVRYQGLVVGQVTHVALDDEDQGVMVTVKMSHMVEDLLRRDTQFWLVSPKASLTGIEGLDALFSGNYITMSPGEGPKRYQYVGTFEAPVRATQDGGLTVELLAERRGSLDVGSGVYFQQVEVGQILKYELDPDTRQVHLTAVIEPEYRSLVRDNSLFWNASGARVRAGLDGVDVELDSLATLLAGGVSFSSPADGEPAHHGSVFALHDSVAAAEPTFDVLFKADHAEGLRVGTPIQHRGLKLGEVYSIHLNDDGVQLSARVSGEYRHLFNRNSQFWRAGAEFGLDGVKHLDTLLFGDFIALLPGDGEPGTRFTLHDGRPKGQLPGRLVTLTQQSAEGLSVGAPILFRSFPVGEVTHLALAGDHVEVTAWITAPYHELIKANSLFWRHGGVTIDADLSGLKVQSAPLANLIRGGLSFSTGSGDAAAEDAVFAIHESEKAARQGPPARLVLHTDALLGLSLGAPVYFRELEVGKVAAIDLVDDGFRVALAIDAPYRAQIGTGSRFWHRSQVKVEGSLAGVAIEAGPLPQLLRGGLAFDHRGTLQAGAPEDRTIYPDRDAALSPRVSFTLYAKPQARVPVKAGIRYLGHEVGRIDSVALSDDLKFQTLTASIDARFAEPFLNQDSRFYLVSAELNLAGAKNLDTLLTGNYVAVLPGESTQQDDAFTLLEEVPVLLPYDGGLRLVLNQPRLGSLQIGSPVLYRQMKVGEVVHTRLAEDAASVDIEIQLDPRHQHLVNRSSRFWNASGLYLDFGLFSGAQIATESVESLLIGGIAFATEQAGDEANAVAAGERFPLADTADARWLQWQPRF
ncbi:MlaD family protein [Ferrimonas balearica]|uniref:MlaD family protein n=1 Tax=Ferrimonas balearica TaxID=44012 RepID=UPI001C99A2D7|nr:MlaD family protein [Ferrimonas balearica]MBY5991569.1 MCE family protein [Ferrimonas balearica]